LNVTFKDISPCPETASFASRIPDTIQRSAPAGTKLTRRSRLPVICCVAPEKRTPQWDC
jgi:hypothetical protein